MVGVEDLEVKRANIRHHDVEAEFFEKANRFSIEMLSDAIFPPAIFRRQHSDKFSPLRRLEIHLFFSVEEDFSFVRVNVRDSSEEQRFTCARFSENTNTFAGFNGKINRSAVSKD